MKVLWRVMGMRMTLKVLKFRVMVMVMRVSTLVLRRVSTLLDWAIYIWPLQEII
jgi:hypothetical protein